MKRLGISALILVGMLTGANAAVPQQRRGTAAGNNAPAQSNTTSARSAVSARSAARTPAAGTSSNATAARAATSGRTTVARGAQPSASTTTAARSATVSARAGATQKVIGTGTKVAAATKNIVVSEECQQKYDGCMDSFCMIDNASGGRCMCSDRNKELDAILAEIEKLDQQSYQMATVGVERIEMGNDAEQAIANANAAAQSVINNQNNDKKTTTRRQLDLSLWNTQIDFDDDDDAFASGDIDAIEGKEGDALHRAASEICVAMMPECSAEKSMLQMMYAQRIKSDCTAYENNLKQQKSSSQQKLYAAEKALRDAALDQLRTANKYDLGQCTVEFKKCMATTAGCGDDFKGCVGIAAAENAKKGYGNSSSMKMYDIKGSATKISIAASSYDALESKKPLCMNVTNSCVAVKDQVWDTFLREVAPQIKTAELLAESDLRTSCISNISQCFQKACKDTMDPNDPDGSYDMCLSRPETVRSLCKVQIDPCISAEPLILDFVYARLAAMRVDSCTNEVKQCLQSDDRCGSDYTQCIGLDTDSIIRMCPYDKLVGCQKVYGETDIRGEAVYDELATMVQGIMLNIDNNLMTECQNAANEAMIKVCGDIESCSAFDLDDMMGAESLTSHREENGDYVIDGLVSFGNVKIKEVTSTKDEVKFGTYEVDINDYKSKINEAGAGSERIIESLQATSNKINQVIAAISEDPKVKMCMYGRDVSRVFGSANRRDENTDDKAGQRFPHLLDSMILSVINYGIDRAKENYNKKYEKLVNEALENANDDEKSAICAAMATNPNQLECDSTAGCKSKSPLASLFVEDADGGFQSSVGSEQYATRYVINGLSMQEKMKVAASGDGDFYQTDGRGHMLGVVHMSSVYSPDSNVCTITTTTTACKKVNNSYSYVGYRYAGYGHVVRVVQFNGVKCTEFGAPKESTMTIRL